MPHDEFWMVQHQEDGVIYGTCRTCGWTTTRYPDNGIVPRQMEMECRRHTERPQAITIDNDHAKVA